MLNWYSTPRARKSETALKRLSLLRGLRLRKTDDFLPGLELATLLEKFHALEALENVTLGRNSAGPFETAMLRHSDVLLLKKGARL